MSRFNASPAAPRSPHRLGYTVFLLCALVGVSSALLARGFDFYLLGVQERVEHQDFRLLSPGSSVGHAYGIIGTALILTNLLYLVRRRFARARLGSMRLWLDIHVFTGLFGSALIVFHSAFQLRTPIATLTSFSLGLVVASGLLGRYLYALAPEPVEARIEAELSAIARAAPQLGAQLRGALSGQAAAHELARPSLIAALAAVPGWLRQARARRAAVEQVGAHFVTATPLSPDEAGWVIASTSRLATLCAAHARGQGAAALLRSWRGLHRFMALVMIASVTVHIAVAWYFGFRGMLSE